MATAEARRLHERTGQKVCIVDLRGRVRWLDIWSGNPILTQWTGDSVARLVNCGGARPYIASKTVTHWTWKEWDIAPGEIHFEEGETAFASRYAGQVVVEPHTKVPNGNKSWPWGRWQALVDSTRDVRFVQLGPHGTRWLARVEPVVTNFRQACAILAASRAFVGTEGALHHAAAAVSTPAVTLWSHFIDPRFTGYATQRNLRHAAGWCGSRRPCPECSASMDRITVDEVRTNLREML